MRHYERHLKQVVLVQAYCRRWLAVRAFDAIKSGQLALSTLRRFLHLLDIGQRDYDEEMQVTLSSFFFLFFLFLFLFCQDFLKMLNLNAIVQVQQLKSVVVQTIRRNKQLEKDLNTMDIKIGLLVKNQIALQEVVAHGHKLRRHVSRRHDASTDPLTTSSSGTGFTSTTSSAYPSYSNRLGYSSIAFSILNFLRGFSLRILFEIVKLTHSLVVAGAKVTRARGSSYCR